MAKFGVKMQRTASTTLATGSLTAAATGMRRARVYDLFFGSEATAGDGNFLWSVQRCTTAGTAGTNPIPLSLDPSDSLATTIVCGQAHSIDPTGATELMAIPLNQRATFRWVAAPGGELVIPATAASGIKFATPTAGSLVAVTVSAMFDEQ